MSEDGFSDSSDEPNMEIQIETLMGSSFDLRVSATDTVQDIKRRIYRVEGIAVTHQNLIFQNKELKDCEKLVDVGIEDGSKLTLVLSMRGGPISTRRLTSARDHQRLMKELKELLDTARNEIDGKLNPGSKVSFLFYKDGNTINLLRVIENKDGSYTPYNKKVISPPSKWYSSDESRKVLMDDVYERLNEDARMATNITELRKKMEDLAIRKQKAKNKEECVNIEPTENLTMFLGETCSTMSFSSLDDDITNFLEPLNLTIIERRERKKENQAKSCNDDEREEGNQSENEEIALKEKHRNKLLCNPRSRIPLSSKSLYSESKGAHSYTKDMYTRIHKTARDSPKAETSDIDSHEVLGSPILSPLCLKGSEDASIPEIDKTVAPTVVEEMAVAGSNSLHLARLVIAENSERQKSTTSSLEIEENSSDIWPLTHKTRPRLNSATYKFGVLKRRPSLNYGIDETPSEVPPGFSYVQSSCYEVCSSNNIFRMPSPFMSSPSAIPPQYAPKNQELSDYYYRNGPRSVSSVSEHSFSRNLEDLNKFAKLPEIKTADKHGTYLGDYSGIQKLKNDRLETNSNLISTDDGLMIHDRLSSCCNSCSASNCPNQTKEAIDLEMKTEVKAKTKLAPIAKKRSRCNFCNRKLNITNMYDCRCGKIFCSQHRYSEVHQCNYDYKTEGRRFLEQQNPIVVARKIDKF